jgi:Tol biopolymer transport system component
MEGTSGAAFPFWSPDSRSVGFFADRKVKTAAVSGGAPEVLADAPDARGGAWSPDGTIVFAPSIAGPLYRVAATGGKATPATNLDPSRAERGHRWPQFFPNSRRFLFLNLCGRLDDQGIYVGSLDSPDRQMLLKNNLRAEFAAGHLFYPRGGTLWAQALDPAAVKLIGQPFQVAQEIGYTAGPRYGSFSVSDAGTLAWVVAPGGAIRRLQWFDRKGQPMAAITQPADWRVSSVSSDDQKILASDNDPVTGNRAIFMLDAVRGTSTRLTYNPVDEFGGYWSPDGTQIAFNSARAGLPDIYLKSVTGRGSDAPLAMAEGAAFLSDWSAHYIAFHDRAQSTGNDLWILPMSPRGQPSPFLRTPYSESQGMISPDERWIAYTSDESGGSQIYVQPFPSGGEKVRVSANGGFNPSWRRDGKELFFMSPAGEMMSAPVRLIGRFETGVPQALFRIPGPPVISIIYPTFVPSADGQRFLIVVAPEPTRPLPITAVVNWKPAQ